MLSSITLTTLNYTAPSAQVTQKRRKFCIQVSVLNNKYRLILSTPEPQSLFFFTDEGNQALQEFLAARNPRQQHSSTLESYLIKPIQRILKYPLLLQQLRNLTDPQSNQHQHLVGKLKEKFNFQHPEEISP